MSYPKEPIRENTSAYFVMDRSNVDEMTRLEGQDVMLTKGMGGVLSEQPDPALFRSVLDVGCGTGGWLREAARAYPAIHRLCGADISTTMLIYARTQTEAQNLEGRVQFQAMDALRILEFPDASFDLVNQRLGTSWVRTWEWTKLLLEYQRVCRPGGIIRITEGSIVIESNSPALTTLNDIALTTVYHSGRLFSPSGDGLISHLKELMKRHAIENVQSHLHMLTYRAGTPEWQHFYDDMECFYRVALPFFNRWTRVPKDYQETYKQALAEMQQPDFFATWTFLTCWGTKRLYGEPLLMRGLR